MKKAFLFIACLWMAATAFAQKAPSHQQWDKLLKKHVNTSGMVDYKGFQKDKTELDAYLKNLSDNAPQASWSENEQKAYRSMRTMRTPFHSSLCIIRLRVLKILAVKYIKSILPGTFNL